MMEISMYSLEHIHFAYGANHVIRDVCLSFDGGCFYGIIGPNGCGKTTLIDLLSGRLKADRGTIHFNGQPLERHRPADLARAIALVPQDFRIDFPYTCEEIIMMGRYPHIPRFSRPSDQDHAVVDRVIQQATLGEYGHRYINHLSDGERQRVIFARGLAQDTPVLLLDEATSNLDMQHTIEMLNLAADRVSKGALVIAVMHDVNLAATYCDRLVCMQDGTVYSAGPLETVLCAETLQAVFHVQTKVSHDAYSGKPQVTFKREVSL